MTRRDLKALDKRLPTGWLRLVQQRLKRKRVAASLAAISRVKNLQYKNDTIMNEVLAVAAEEDARRTALAARMRGEALTA